MIEALVAILVLSVASYSFMRMASDTMHSMRLTIASSKFLEGIDLIDFYLRDKMLAYVFSSPLSPETCTQGGSALEARLSEEVFLEPNLVIRLARWSPPDIPEEDFNELLREQQRCYEANAFLRSDMEEDYTGRAVFDFCQELVLADPGRVETGEEPLAFYSPAFIVAQVVPMNLFSSSPVACQNVVDEVIDQPLGIRINYKLVWTEPGSGSRQSVIRKWSEN